MRGQFIQKAGLDQAPSFQKPSVVPFVLVIGLLLAMVLSPLAFQLKNWSDANLNQSASAQISP